MASTVLFTVVDYLIAELTDDERFQGVLVTDFYPAGDQTIECVWFGDADIETDIPTFKAGTKRSEETITLPIVIEVRKLGETQRQVDLRATEIAAAVDEFLRSDPQLSDAYLDTNQQIIHALPGPSWRQARGAIGTDARGSRWEIDLTIRARSL
jgi:hypothetical protein